MRNTAERNISAMSVKWSSKELANPRALSVIYDGEPIASSLTNYRFAFAFCKSTHFKRSASAGRLTF